MNELFITFYDKTSCIINAFFVVFVDIISLFLYKLVRLIYNRVDMKGREKWP